MQKPNVALIPNWVMTLLSRNGFNVNDLLYFEKIAPFFSKTDLIALEKLQSQALTIFGTELGNSSFSFLAHWSDQTAISQHNDTLYQVKLLLNEQQFAAELRERLFSSDFPPSNKNEAYRIINTSSSVVYVVINDGHFVAQGNVQLQRNITHDVLRALYMYMPFSELASSTLFRKQLESLSV